MRDGERLAPVWLLGFGFLPVGVSGGVALFIVPVLLAAAHVPEAQIATATSLYIAIQALSIGLSPLLDWRFPRQTYAIGFALLTALGILGTLVSVPHVVPLTACLCTVALFCGLCTNAVGGWFGDLLPASKKDALGAWLNVGNFGGFGLITIAAVPLIRDLPDGFGALCIAGFLLLAVPIYLATPCAAADQRLSRCDFRHFARTVLDLFRRRDVQWVLAIFVAPSASFALTNTLPSFGHDFHTPDELVGLLGGVGGSAAGIIGSLLVPPVTRRCSPVALYLLVGLTGAAFTLALLVGPRDWLTFGIAMTGECIFQAAALSAANIITLRTIGHDNPLAATQFGVLLGAWGIPLAYMQYLDGHAYGLGGVAGSFITDAVLSGAASVALGLVYWRFAARPVAA